MVTVPAVSYVLSVPRVQFNVILRLCTPSPALHGPPVHPDRIPLFFSASWVSFSSSSRAIELCCFLPECLVRFLFSLKTLLTPFQRWDPIPLPSVGNFVGARFPRFWRALSGRGVTRVRLKSMGFTSRWLGSRLRSRCQHGTERRAK